MNPRIDPVFGDVTVLRRTVDRFLALQVEMDQVRNEFSTAVHSTLAEVTRPTGRGENRAAKVCPPSAAALYGRALAAGGRYLGLGREMESRFREIRRADELGDASGLTPDYRLKVKKASQSHQDMLRDLREMRVAFYVQLGAELRHAGCDLPGSGASGGPAAGADDAIATDPSNPAAWTLDDSATDPEASGGADPSRTVRTPPKTSAPPTTAPAVWIEIDNSHCARPSQLQIDGRSYGALPGRKRTSVRTHAGPHEICVQPSQEKRSCGEPGTLRQVYFYEGWSLTVRCDR
ncbi:MAG TPA: hypothetical protein VJ801_09360 [Polyangia bacterium]|nr:hypothetical protein [Polyangia bacterium]